MSCLSIPNRSNWREDELVSLTSPSSLRNSLSAADGGLIPVSSSLFGGHALELFSQLSEVEVWKPQRLPRWGFRFFRPLKRLRHRLSSFEAKFFFGSSLRAAAFVFFSRAARAQIIASNPRSSAVRLLLRSVSGLLGLEPCSMEHFQEIWVDSDL